MSFVQMMMGVGILFIVLLLAVLFVIPTDTRPVNGKRKKKEAPPEPEKKPETDAMISHLQRANHKLQEQLWQADHRIKELEKQNFVEQVKLKKVQEKLNQERGWQEREQTETEKKAKDFDRLKDEITELQKDFDREHGATLRLEGELRDERQRANQLAEERRRFEAETIKLQGEVRAKIDEIIALKKDNAGLKKKQDDVTWIAKSEFVKLEKQLKEKEKEIERLIRERK
jgi:chromosome segregation ATPase